MRQMAAGEMLEKIAGVLLSGSKHLDDTYLAGQLAVAAEILRNLSTRVEWSNDAASFFASELIAIQQATTAGGVEALPPSNTSVGADHVVDEVAAMRRWAREHGREDIVRRIDHMVTEQLDDEISRLRR